MSHAGACPTHGTVQLSIITIDDTDTIHIRSWLVCAQLANNLAGDLGAPSQETLVTVAAADQAARILAGTAVDITTDANGGSGARG